VFPASQLGFNHQPLGRMVQSEPEPTFPETKAASMATMDSAIGGNLTVPMTRTRTSTMIALLGQTVLSREPRELQVSATFDSRADNRAPPDQRSFRPHFIHKPGFFYEATVQYSRSCLKGLPLHFLVLCNLISRFLFTMIHIHTSAHDLLISRKPNVGPINDACRRNSNHKHNPSLSNWAYHV
jgi:hypothetical protein